MNAYCIFNRCFDLRILALPRSSETKSRLSSLCFRFRFATCRASFVLVPLKKWCYMVLHWKHPSSPCPDCVKLILCLPPALLRAELDLEAALACVPTAKGLWMLRSVISNKQENIEAHTIIDRPEYWESQKPKKKMFSSPKKRDKRLADEPSRTSFAVNSENDFWSRI